MSIEIYKQGKRDIRTALDSSTICVCKYANTRGPGELVTGNEHTFSDKQPNGQRQPRAVAAVTPVLGIASRTDKLFY